MKSLKLQRGFLLNPFRFGPAGPVGDPLWASVLMLLKSRTPAGSVIFDDVSPYARVLTPVGNVKSSTSTIKWNPASMEFDGSGDQITIPNTVETRFGTRDYTIDFWVYPRVVNNFQHIYQSANFETGQLNVRITSTGLVQVFHNTGIGTLNLSSSVALAINTWAYVEVSRIAGTTRIFINGILRGSAATAYNVNSATGLIRLGSRNDTASFQFNGFLDELRVTAAGRNSANYTPPTGPQLTF